MSFIPAAWAQGMNVAMGAAVDASEVPSGWSQCISECGSPADPNNHYSPTNPDNAGSKYNYVYGQHNGLQVGSCSVAAPGFSSSGALVGLGFIGLAITLTFARRRRG